MMAKRGQGEGSISKRPDGTWWARITLGKDENGKQKRRAFYGKTRKEVQEKLTAALNEVNNDTYIEPTKMTVAQWMDFWLKEYKERFVKPTTYARLECIIRCHIKPNLGAYRLKDIKTEIIQKFINQLSDKGLSTGTIINTYSILHGAMKQAVINENISKNPADNLILPKNKKKKEPRALTLDEQNRFIKVALEDFREFQSEMFVLALFTGLRFGELLALTWNDIDFDNGLLYVNKAEASYMDHSNGTAKWKSIVQSPKSKSSTRIIPLVPEVLDMLKAYKETSVSEELLFYVIDGSGHYTRMEYRLKNMDKGCMIKHIPRGTAVDRFKMIIKAAEIEGVSIHSLRHTFATRGLESGIELIVMQELLGHSSIKMTADVYSHVLPDKKKDSIMKLSNLWKDTQ